MSSISVSRPALSIPPPPPDRRPKLMVAFFAMLAIIGGGLGASAVNRGLSPTRHGEPSRIEQSPRRALQKLDPPSTPGKASKEIPVVRVAPPPPPPPQPKVAKPNPCDPPFTIDPETGRKKYKLECK